MARVNLVELHPAQDEVFNDRTRFRVVVAGRRWGKTTLSKVVALQKACAKKRSKIWYVAPTYGMAREIMWNELKQFIPIEWVAKTHETQLTITLVNGSIISLKGADDPDRLRGVGLDFIICDEFQDMRPDTWETVLRPTLSTTQGGAMFIGTPKSFNQLYKLYQKGMAQKRATTREWNAWQFVTADSPFVRRGEIEAAKADLDPKTFRQEFEARFESMSGRVYYPFDRKIHVGSYKFNSKLPILIGQDFNIDPMSTAVIQIQPSGEIWIVDEIVQFNSNVSEVCDELDKRYYRYMKQMTIYPDPAGQNRQHGRGESSLDIFRERGFADIRYRKKHPFVQDRINAVNSLLMSTDGTVRLKVDESCRNVIDGFEQVIYKKGSTEVDKSLNKEHVLDAIGYPMELIYPTRRVTIMGVNI